MGDNVNELLMFNCPQCVLWFEDFKGQISNLSLLAWDLFYFRSRFVPAAEILDIYLT